MGDVVVQHVADTFHVESTGSNVGCHQNIQAAIFQLVNRAFTLCLCDVAVDGSSRETAGTKLFRQFLGFVLGTHEHDHRSKFGDLKNAGQRVQLVAVRNVEEFLRDVCVGTGFRLDGDLSWILQVLLGHAANRRWHGRGEQRHLLVIWGVFQDSFHILLEPHVEHLICLIQHKETQTRNVQRPLFKVVNHSTWGTNNNVCTAAKPRQLNAVSLTSVNGQHVQAAQVVSEGLERVSNLECQLTCGSQYQCLGGTHRGVDARQDREGKCGCFAGAGLREANNIVAVH